MVAVADEDCQIHLRQIVNPWSLGMLSASFWSLLVGLLFMNPLLGGFAGAAAGAFMKEVAADLSPGKAVLFMMARIINSDRVASHLVDFRGTVLPTNLSSTDEAKLRAHFKAARKA